VLNDCRPFLSSGVCPRPLPETAGLSLRRAGSGVLRTTKHRSGFSAVGFSTCCIILLLSFLSRNLLLPSFGSRVSVRKSSRQMVALVGAPRSQHCDWLVLFHAQPLASGSVPLQGQSAMPVQAQYSACVPLLPPPPPSSLDDNYPAQARRKTSTQIDPSDRTPVDGRRLASGTACMSAPCSASPGALCVVSLRRCWAAFPYAASHAHPYTCRSKCIWPAYLSKNSARPSQRALQQTPIFPLSWVK
jgi:hypothetical protein